MDGNIPEDLLATRIDPQRDAFPANMRPDVLPTQFEVDIDVLTPPPPELRREMRVQRPPQEEQGWFVDDQDQDDNPPGEISDQNNRADITCD